ncbi:FAD-dependent oxidoreductase [Microbacterium rhizomatis]|uniref:Cyclic nucleotide-binding domain-containing protein n=1 Tax=Microbacterium rhizomatis TaxID=1631477 RepID=A0A5J5J9B8_9MICO|nr:cyclic nucleotide-binding domain-containing thioredoxin-disulfide reductase [Microbacterium rhizomatis]KAA9111393.1 cyclic nucleotide-binding domain-containing protein [Microbacterium rhizomatis]
MSTSSSSEAEFSDLPETPDTYGAYPRLADEQIGLLSRYGQRKRLAKGSTLFCEGDRDCGLFVVLDGQVRVVQDDNPEGPRVIAVHGRGRFVGDLSMLTGQAVYVTAVAQTDVEVLEILYDRLKEAVTQSQALGDLILRAFILRRNIHADLGIGLRIIGSRYSADTRRLRDFASRNRVPYRWEDLEQDAEAESTLQAFDISPDETPIVIWKGHNILRNPSNTELAELLGLREDAAPRDAVDILVVGAGPAGLAAAVAAASEGLSTVVLDAIATGGQAGTSSQIENYLGFPAGISGGELADRAVVQARKFGAAFMIPGEAQSLEHIDGHFDVGLIDGAHVEAHTVVLATGVRFRRLSVPGMDRFEGPHVYYAATEFEARLCRGDPVVIVGGGNSAGQAALFLARTAADVTLMIRHDDLTRDMSRYLAERITADPRVQVWRNCEVCELRGDQRLEEVIVQDLKTGERRSHAATALFVLIGSEPHTRWLTGAIALDERGFVMTGAGTGAAVMFETSSAGVFAVGDVRSGSVKRVASAAGEGAVAVRLVYEHLVQAGRR